MVRAHLDIDKTPVVRAHLDIDKTLVFLEKKGGGANAPFAPVWLRPCNVFTIFVSDGIAEIKIQKRSMEKGSVHCIDGITGVGWHYRLWEQPLGGRLQPLSRFLMWDDIRILMLTAASEMCKSLL